MSPSCRHRLGFLFALLPLAMPGAPAHCLSGADCGSISDCGQSISTEPDTNTYSDLVTRELIGIARIRHFYQDSLVHDYAATVRTRVDVGLGRNRFVRIPPFVAYETVSRLTWREPNDLKLEVLGIRATSHFEGVTAELVFDEPWFVPRSLGDSIRLVADAFPERAAVHPLAYGAEEFYRYAIFDSLSIGLPGRVVRAIGVRVEPKFRAPSLIAGKMWLDAETAEVVRLTFVFLGEFLWDQPEGTTPEDTVEARNDNDFANRLLTVEANLEYALHELRYWMPRRQLIQVTVEIPFLINVVLPVRFITTFDEYEINTDPTLDFTAVLAADSAARERDTGVRAEMVTLPDGSTVTVIEEDEKEKEDDENDRRRRNRVVRCPDGASGCRLSKEARNDFGYVRGGSSSSGRWEIAYPPRDTMLAYEWPDELDLGEETGEERRLLETISSLAEMSEQLPAEWVGRTRYGLAWEKAADVFRFNRVQGPSFGLGYQYRPGPAFSVLYAKARFGLTDHRLTGSLSWRRDAPGGRLDIRVYRSIQEAEPWTRGQSLGNSFNALFAGHDDADYHLALGSGVSFLGNRGRMREVEIGIFLERDRSIDTVATSGINDALGGDGRFQDNPRIAEGDYVRAAVSRRTRWGSIEFRQGVEGVVGDTTATGRLWGTAKAPFTVVTREGALSLKVGGVVGDELPQFLFRAGGSRSIRGYDYGSRSGRVFWSAQLDFTLRDRGVLSWVAFIDAGDAARNVRELTSSAPLLAAGGGVSLFEGWIRLNLAKGLRPSEGVRFDLLFQAPR